MKSLRIQISDIEFKKLGLKTNEISFSELLKIIEKRISLKTLDKSVKLARKYGHSDMTMDEINEEVKAYRNAKGNS